MKAGKILDEIQEYITTELQNARAEVYKSYNDAMAQLKKLSCRRRITHIKRSTEKALKLLRQTEARLQERRDSDK